MDAFAEEFLERYARHWKPRTLESSACVIRNHILPAFGHLTVDAIAVEHVGDWFASMADRPGSANRAMPALSVMMRMAEVWGYRPHHSNPCKNTRRYRTQAKERFLTAEDMARLNAVLTRDEFWCPHVVAVIRLLMLTGCRLGEVLALEWDWIKGRRIHLPDSKSGPRTVWLSGAARAVIDAIPRYSPDCSFLFPARPPTRHITGIEYRWHRIRNEAGLPGLRLHDLRHCSWASTAAMNGVDMVTIAKLLGHALVETTAGYAPTLPTGTWSRRGEGRSRHRPRHGGHGRTARRGAIDTPPLRRIRCNLTAPRTGPASGRRPGRGARDKM